MTDVDMAMPDIDGPSLRIGPSVCLLLADRLAEALESLRGWKFRASDSSRLPTAVRVLREVAEAGVFPTSKQGRTKAGNAIRAGLDYPRLCDALRKGSPEPLREIVRRSLGGTLADVGPTEAHRAQSELRVASTITASGRNALIPPPAGGKRPDLVVQIDTLPFAIEVKRPASIDAVTDNIEAAVKQLNDFGSRYSAICLDLTDCVAGAVVMDQPDGGADLVRRRFLVLDAQASGYIGPHQHRPGYDRIALVFTMATPVLWRIQQDLTVHPMLLGGFNSYPAAVSGLIVEQTRALVRTLENGFRSLGASLGPD